MTYYSTIIHEARYTQANEGGVNFHFVLSKIFFVPPCLCGWVLFLQYKCATQPVLHSIPAAGFKKKAPHTRV
jgi:hypothetical protein